MTEENLTRRRRRNTKNKNLWRKSPEKHNVNLSNSKSVVKLSDVLSSERKTDRTQAQGPKLKVSAKLLSKKFELSQNEKLREVLGIGKKNREIKEFWALRNVNFDVFDGEAIGIVGLNGSGKSTLLNIIDKSLSSSAGELVINGEVSQIAIGAGLKDGLTGRDNIRLKGTMMGLSKKEIEDRMPDIIQFSELGPFIDRQVKDYSSGMRSKLAFSIAINHDPDILIIDEALSVGDSTFAAKSAKKMFEFRERGKTIFVVSHNAAQIKKWTDKVVWLHYGEVKEYGSTADVLPKYQAFINWFNGLSKAQQDQYKLDRRQEQQDFSVTALKQEVIDNSPLEAGQASLALIDETIKKNKQKSSMSFGSKLLVGACVLFMMFGVTVSVKGGSLSNFGMPLAKKSTTIKPKAPTKNKRNHKQSSTSKSTTAKESSTDASDTFDYTVKAGDTISGIAARYSMTSEDIQKLNPRLDPSLISPGMAIKLPKAVEAKTSANETTTTPPTYVAPESVTDVSDDTVQTGEVQSDVADIQPPTSE